MVSIETDRPEYANDVAEEVRLFLGNVPIAFEPVGGAEISIRLTGAHSCGRIRVTASAANALSDYECPLPEDSKLLKKRYEKRAYKIALFRLLRTLYPDVSAPWGSLTGIRPTKLFRELTKGGGEAAAREAFLHTFDVSPEKTALAERICRAQKPLVEGAQKDDIDVYVGVPYCKSRCLYCSFGSLLAKDASTLETYLSALFADISMGAAIVRETGRTVRATYFGGGTPSILSAQQIDRLLSHMEKEYGSLGAECTFEAGRPDTFDPEKLAVLRAHGVGRISVNPQSMNDETLCRIGRLHTSADVVRGFYEAREAGFSSINMDLIVGLPGETIDDVERTLKRVDALSPDSLTVHTLAVKRSSRLAAHLDEFPMPEAETAERMVKLCADYAESMRLYPYYMYRQKYMRGNLENVGYAREDGVCRYNVDMMEELSSIMAHGAKAISKRVYEEDNRIERVPNPSDVPTYIGKLPALWSAKKEVFCD